jgi:hypothetical protein
MSVVARRAEDEQAAQLAVKFGPVSVVHLKLKARGRKQKTRRPTKPLIF